MTVFGAGWKSTVWATSITALAMALPAVAKERAASGKAGEAAQVGYGAPPAWVVAPPAATEASTPEGSPFRVVYADQQVHFDRSVTTTVSAYRVRLLSPQALAFGSLTLQWNPSSQAVTVNQVMIHRGVQTIDVLKAARFAVIQREANLEASILTGILTATLQVPGLQVGDELELRTTISDRDTILGNRLFGGSLMGLAQGPGANRIQATWTADRSPRFAASSDLRPHQLSPQGRTATWEWRDPPTLQAIDRAPVRYNIARLVEYSDIPDWNHVSGGLFPLFDAAAGLPAETAIHAEIARISSLSTDPVVRAGEALMVVQEAIRYVYVGLDGGNYRPVAADQTWRTRFGDCKAKSVLLMALLRGLGIDAEFVLVNSNGGDGLAERLPGPHVFDHIIVRAKIGDQSYYLDGTGYGDHALRFTEQPAYRYVLPLSADGATLEELQPKTPRRPSLIRTIAIDASKGFSDKATVTQVNYVMGVEATKIRVALAALAPAQADQALRGYWRGEEYWIEPEKVSWRYDDAKSAAVLTIVGSADADWEGSAKEGRYNVVPRAGFSPPSELKRPPEQDQTVPYVTDYPSYVCSVTNMKLPKPAAPYVWRLDGKGYDTVIGGERYVRRATLGAGFLTSTRISQTFLPEVSADQAKAVNDAIPKFDNSKLLVEEGFPLRGVAIDRSEGPRIDVIDWTDVATPCSLGRVPTGK